MCYVSEPLYSDVFYYLLNYYVGLFILLSTIMLGCVLLSFELLSMCVIMNCYTCFVSSFIIVVALSLRRWMVAWKNW
jgi:hypothetical protein